MCCFAPLRTRGCRTRKAEMDTRDEAYQKRALRRRAARRAALMDPMSATDRTRLGDDRNIAATAIRRALTHIASAGKASLLDDRTGFRSEQRYCDMAACVLDSFGDMSVESGRHVESILLRACSTDGFWRIAAELVESEAASDDIEKAASDIPLPPGMFQEASRVAVGDPHTQVVIGPLFSSDTLAFSVYPLYRTGGRGSHPIRVPISELMRRSGSAAANWVSSWERDTLVFSAGGATVRFPHDTLTKRWPGPEADRAEIEGWTVMSD